MPGVRLGVEERQAIEVALARDEPFATMARRLQRPTSTVSREVNGNGGRCGYRANLAQRASGVRARRPKVGKLVANVKLAAVVADGLTKRWSPAEVAARQPDPAKGLKACRDLARQLERKHPDARPHCVKGSRRCSPWPASASPAGCASR